MATSRTTSLFLCLATVSVVILVIVQVRLLGGTSVSPLGTPHVIGQQPSSIYHSNYSTLGNITTSLSEYLFHHTVSLSSSSSSTSSSLTLELEKKVELMKEEKDAARMRVVELENELSTLKDQISVEEEKRESAQQLQVETTLISKHRTKCKTKYPQSASLTMKEIAEMILHDSNVVSGASNDIIVLGVGHSGTSSVAKLLQWYMSKEHDDDRFNVDPEFNINTWKVENEAGSLGEDRRVNYLNGKVVAQTHIEDVPTKGHGGSVTIPELARKINNKSTRKIITENPYALKLWKGYSRPCLLKDPRFVWTLHL
jgi:hypothetical protein